MGSSYLKRNLEEFVRKNDFAPWYRGFSTYQEEAIRNVASSLRDDFEQGTSYRAESCLINIGVNPIPSPKKVRAIVQLSRGNDLAFLFFILEGYYKTFNKDNTYCINEQMLMTAITKLDLIATLRELDRILPPGHPAKKKEVRHGRSTVRKIKAQGKESSDSKTSQLVESPYFQRQPRPKQIEMNLICHEQDLVVALPFWPLNKEADYGQDTPPPWFMAYELNPARRIIKHAVDDAVNNYFAKIEQDSKGSVQATQSEAEEREMLCLYHMNLREQAEMLKNELKVRARERCLEMIDVSLRERTKRHDRIVAQLEHDVELCAEKYNKITKFEHTILHVVGRPNCMVCRALVSTPVTNNEIKALTGDGDEIAHTNVLQTYKGKRLTGGGVRMEEVDFGGDLELCKGSAPPPSNCVDPKEPTPKRGKCQQPGRISFTPDNKKQQSPIDVRSSTKQTKKIFFKAPETHKPYHFEYKRMFRSGRKEINDVDKHIAKCFVRALDKPYVSDDVPDPYALQEEDEAEAKEQPYEKLDISRSKLTNSSDSTENTSDHSKYSRVDYKAEVVDAVVRCAKEIWMKKAEKKRLEMEEAEANAHSDGAEVLKYDIDYFDPDDDKLMNRLLEDGMNELRKNQRFVLATLPEAHKVPILREWVKRRYGKRYAPAELKANTKEAAKIFEAVMLLQTSAPDVKKMGMDDEPTSYNKYGAAKKLAKQIKANYHEELNSLFLTQLISCWYAMGNYQCPGGPPRKTFYAYMPANHRDILRHHVWNGEFRNYRQLRDMMETRRSGKVRR